MSLFEEIMKVVETANETTTEWKAEEIKKLMQALTQGDCIIKGSFMFTNVTRNDMVQSVTESIRSRRVSKLMKLKNSEGMDSIKAKEFAWENVDESEISKEAEKIVDQFTEDEIEQAIAQAFENQETTVTNEVLDKLVYNVFNKGSVGSYLNALNL